ncbi:hypothetical protein PV797_13020 [Clostridiaceae bacterium M8S5]|nr:hypothetical protein PV797_13020 [Clostridiaceae bacterium M8S5]
MFKTRSKVVFTSLLLATIYFIYIVQHFFGAIASTSGAEQIGAGIAAVLVYPHMLLLGIGIIFGFIAFLQIKDGQILHR